MLNNLYDMLKNIVILIITILFTVSLTAETPTFTVGTESIINIQNSGTALNLGDDSMSGMKDIGFDFTFYDQTFDQVNISMNGFFTFQSNFSIPRNRNYLSEVIPATSFNYSVFPLWTDLINRNGTRNPYIQTFGNTSDTNQYFVIGWYNAKEYSNQLQNSFEAILYEGTNEIQFRYDKIQIRTHDITIGVQGNNEATTYLRYEDTNAKQYMQTDDFSVTTATEVIDESFSNLSSECLVDSSYSELCDVYDLTNDFEEEDYLYGAGVTDSMLFGYDEEEDFYGFDEDERNLYGGEGVLEDVSFGHTSSDSHDISFITSDIFSSDEYYLEDEYISLDNDFSFTDNSFIPEVEEISFIPLEDVTDIEIIDIFEIQMEEEFVEFAQHMDEHFDFQDEMDREEWDEQFEDFEEERIIEEEEQIVDEQTEETAPDQIEEEAFTEENFIEQELELLDEVEENRDTRQERRSRIRSVVASTNALLERINPNITGGTSSSSNTTISVSSNTSGAASSPMSVSSSPSMSDQIASSQAQTNTVLQSINIVPMPSLGNMPSAVMAEVQVTTMDSQIESMTSTMMTASEADQIADQIVANNIRAQQQESQQQEQESGRYDTEGQATLLAYMNYLPGFTAYTDMSIPDQSNWYTPRTMYADVTIQDNVAAYGELVSNSVNTLGQIIGGQPNEFFNRRVR